MKGSTVLLGGLCRCWVYVGHEGLLYRCKGEARVGLWVGLNYGSLLRRKLCNTDCELNWADT